MSDVLKWYKFQYRPRKDLLIDVEPETRQELFICITNPMAYSGQLEKALQVEW